jgi:hypothetical protein
MPSLQLLIALDQALNTLIPDGPDQPCGWADETISSRSWRMSMVEQGRDPKWATWRRNIDWVALHVFGQADHCKSSYESERQRLQSPPEERTA